MYNIYMLKNNIIVEKRDKIIVEAKKQFLESGVDCTSISKIASSLGVAKSSIFYYFHAKEDILEAVIEKMCIDNISLLEKRINKVKVFESKLLILFDSYYSIYPRLIKDTHVKKVEAEFILQFHEKYLSKINSILDEVVMLGQKSGVLLLDMPKEMLIMTLEGLYGLLRFNDLTFEQIVKLIATSLNLDATTLLEHKTLLTNFTKGGSL